MGKLVDYRNAALKSVGAGANTVAITGADGKNMQADYIKLGANARLEGTVPAGCDQYFFILSGDATLAEKNKPGHAMKFGTFGIVEENHGYVFTTKVPCEVLSVIAPPPGQKTAAPGFKGGMKIVSMHNEHVDDVADKKKQRIYLVTKETAGSERAHGMIVKYVPETETTMHMHPDCESLFVFLEGNTEVTVDGSKKVGSFGKAAFFPCGNKHDLHGTLGNSYFIEFHIPYNYKTVR
jgi:mannose-6-phosphate isomerase-like protein (cupin superfamily)